MTTKTRKPGQGGKNPQSRPKLSSLSAGRPPTISKRQPTVSAKATRTVINQLHTLNKSLAHARAANDTLKTASLEAQLEALGGLERYQQASIQGQSLERGGDSSIVLMAWLRESGITPAALRATEPGTRLRMLEVGALSTGNACATSGVFEVTRIDLHSQAVGITQQDFMERPLPASNAEKFDVLSLSLVLNFVPDAAGRGEMLRRTCVFLDRTVRAAWPGVVGEVCPALFLVLPASCVANSRYMDEERLEGVMGSLGYVRTQRKVTAKLVYYLWRWGGQAEGKKNEWAKKELRTGGSRNNFAVVLKKTK